MDIVFYASAKPKGNNALWATFMTNFIGRMLDLALKALWRIVFIVQLCFIFLKLKTQLKLSAKTFFNDSF